MRAIGLKTGDLQRLSIGGPDDAVVADHTAKPLERDKAEAMVFAGGKRPPPAGLQALIGRAITSAVTEPWCWKPPSKPGSDGDAHQQQMLFGCSLMPASAEPPSVRYGSFAFGAMLQRQQHEADDRDQNVRVEDAPALPGAKLCSLII